MKEVEDGARGIEGSEAWRDGDEGLAFRERVGLSELSVGSGVLGLSTMYMGVSISRNSACDQLVGHATCDSDIPSSLGTPAMMSS